MTKVQIKAEWLMHFGVFFISSGIWNKIIRTEKHDT